MHVAVGPPECTSHISDPRFLEGLVQKTRTKAPCTNSVSIVRGSFCPGGFVRGAFVCKILSGGGFSPFPFCQNTLHQKVKHHLFRICMIKFFRSVMSHALYPSPPVTNCHTSSDPLPLERDVLYGRPLSSIISAYLLTPTYENRRKER